MALNGVTEMLDEADVVVDELDEAPMCCSYGTGLKGSLVADTMEEYCVDFRSENGDLAAFLQFRSDIKTGSSVFDEVKAGLS